MSGGALDYFYYKLEEIADKIAPEYTLLEELTAELLLDLAEVMKELEWWRSGDSSYDDFAKAFMKFAKKWLKNRNEIEKLIKKDKQLQEDK